MATVFDASFSQLDFDIQQSSCNTLYFIKDQNHQYLIDLNQTNFMKLFNQSIDSGVIQNSIVTSIENLLNSSTTHTEILRLYNVSHGTTPETHKEVINHTIINLDNFKAALNRCSVLAESHSPGYKVQFIFIFSIVANAITNVSAFTQKVGVEFLMV